MLKDQNYINIINILIDNEISNYALAIYNPKYLTGNYKDVMFTIYDDLFLEMIFLKVCGETIHVLSVLEKKW